MDSTKPPLSVISSVLLDQGEYFYDDEFSCSYEVQQPVDNNFAMTRSLGNNILPHNNISPLDQSHSDSCIFTPADSGDSGLTSGPAGQTPSSEDNLDVKSNYTPRTKCKQVGNEDIVEISPQNTQSVSSKVSHLSNSFEIHDRHISTRTDGPTRSMEGSLMSNQSTSWMDRSYTPKWKALLSRNVDYKLAYDDFSPHNLDPTTHRPNSSTICEYGEIHDNTSKRVHTIPHNSIQTGYPPQDSPPGLITTWVERHGGRENSKGRSRSASLEIDLSSNSDSQNLNHEQLVSWNQLKKTHNNHCLASPHRNESISSGNTQIPSDRAQSHPILNESLLDIFLRSKALKDNSDSSYFDKHTTTTPTSKNDKCTNTTPTPAIGRNIGLAHVRVKEEEEAKHPLLRGDRILPQRLSVGDPTQMRSFGTQFPPSSNPGPSNLSKANPPLIFSAAPPGRPSKDPTCLPQARKSFPVYPNIARLNSKLSTSDHRSRPILSNAKSMTSSAGPLGAHREYPGLGQLTVPKASRLNSAALLSRTLPDLSFLKQAGTEEDRTGTLTMPKSTMHHHQPCRRQRDSVKRCLCQKCTCRSLSLGRIQRCPPSRQQTDMVADNRRPRLYHDVFDSSLNGSNRQTSADDHHQGSTPSLMQTSSLIVERGRGYSPDPADSLPNTDPNSLEFVNGSGSLFSSRTGPISNCSDPSSSSLSDDRPKKSVSFSDDSTKQRPSSTNCPTSPQLRAIPKTWGLYGDEPPLAEFKPRNSPGREIQPTSGSVRSNVDIRYYAMVNDVIRAVQETVAYFSSIGRGTSDESLLPYTTVAALGSSGRQALAAVVGPLSVLLSDGLLSPSKTVFSSKPRPRLWQLIEESCRSNRSRPTLVTSQALNDALSQVKAIPFATSEKQKFKAFICACLNAKILPKWLEGLVGNEALVKRFYCEDAFLRQCQSSQSGLHADLMTHLQQLVLFPFNFDVNLEARKPLVVEMPSRIGHGESGGQRPLPSVVKPTRQVIHPLRRPPAPPVPSNIRALPRPLSQQEQQDHRPKPTQALHIAAQQRHLPSSTRRPATTKPFVASAESSLTSSSDVAPVKSKLKPPSTAAYRLR